MAKNWKHRRDDAGSMVATVIVIVVGAVICAFLGAADRTQFGDWMLGLVVLVAALMLTAIIRYRYARNSSSGLGFWYALGTDHREDGLASQYRPRKVRDNRTISQPGAQRPISAEEAREIQNTSSNTWVPSRNREGGKP